MDANKNKQNVGRIAAGGDSRPRYSRLFALFAGCFFLGTLSGCEKSTGESEQGTPPTSRVVPDPGRASVTLRIAVAEDAQLAETIKRLRGEWAERSGGELVVEDRTTAEVLSGKYISNETLPPPDLLIFPSRHLGELCEAKRLRPIRKSVLKSEELRANDFFPQVRERLMVFGGETMALPVGCVTAAVVYKSDGESLATWEEMLPRFTSVSDFTWYRLVGGQWTSHAVNRFLACAASHARHASREALLFDPETMQPRIAEPPFMRALRRVVAFVAKEKKELHLSGVGPELRDRQAIILTRFSESLTLVGDWGSARVAPLPGVKEVYNPIANEWETVVGEPRRVPLLATSGRLIGVTTDSRNAAAAFRLAAWLVGTQNARQLSTVSPNVANVRKSLARVADDWTGAGNKELGKQFSAAQAESLSGRHSLLIPRIIRVDDYLTALDKQVQRAITGEATPEEALTAAAAEWEKLTDEIGRDRQRRCYQAHLQGLGE